MKDASKSVFFSVINPKHIIYHLKLKEMPLCFACLARKRVDASNLLKFYSDRANAQGILLVLQKHREVNL